MRQTLFLVLFIIICVRGAQAETLPGKIFYKDGRVDSGFVVVPQLDDKVIKLSHELGGKRTRIKSYDLIEVVVYLEGRRVSYRRIPTKVLFQKNTLNRINYWLQELKVGFVSLYTGYVEKGSGASRVYYMFREDDFAASIVGVKVMGVINIGTDNDFRKKTIEYLSDCPKLVTKLVQKVYGLNDIKEVVDFYNNWRVNEYLSEPSETDSIH